MLMNCDQYYDLKREIVDGIYNLIDYEVYCFLEQGDLIYTVWYNPFVHRVSSYPEDTSFIKIEGKFDIAQAREEDGGGNYFETLIDYARNNFNRKVDFSQLPGDNMYTLEVCEYERERPKNFQKMVSEMASQCMRAFVNHNQVTIVAEDDYVAPDDVQAILEDRRKQYTQQSAQELSVSASIQEDNQNYSGPIPNITGSNEGKLTLDLDNDSSFQDLVKRVEKLENLVNSMTSLFKDWPSFL